MRPESRRARARLKASVSGMRVGFAEASRPACAAAYRAAARIPGVISCCRWAGWAWRFVAAAVARAVVLAVTCWPWAGWPWCRAVAAAPRCGVATGDCEPDAERRAAVVDVTRVAVSDAAG